MKHFCYALIFLISTLIFIGCKMSMISEADIESRALKIVDAFDNKKIDVFKIWEYSPARGGIWYKYSRDSLLYYSLYINKNVDKKDSVALRIYLCRRFLEDFAINLPMDTSLSMLTILKHKSGLLRITGLDSHGRDIIPIDNLNQDSIFLTENPFKTFENLNEIKDSLNIRCVRHTFRLGGIIEFYLSTQYVLTFIPDLKLIDPRFRQTWLNNLATGKELKEHWNLRKLDKPMEFE